MSRQDGEIAKDCKHQAVARLGGRRIVGGVQGVIPSAFKINGGCGASLLERLAIFEHFGN